jgi:hypothetical protein
MAFVRHKKQGNSVYYYLVETLPGHPRRQHVIRYYGTHPPHGPQKGLKGTTYVQ